MERDRSPRSRRSVSGSSAVMRTNPRRAPAERRVFISNMPFETKWQEIKDLFRENVGDVTYVEMFKDEHDHPRGCAILEFATEELAKKAVEKMHRTDLRGRKLVVKEDFDMDRDQYGKIVTKGRGPPGPRPGMGGPGMGGMGLMGPGGPPPMPAQGYGNTYGLSVEFLQSLGIDGPLHTRLFVVNLSYDVDESKLREVFRLAGRVMNATLNRDKDGKSRGHGTIEYTHPVEAVQALSMFNQQPLFERNMTVRFDIKPGPMPEELDMLPDRLPEGLGNVGMGLGAGGNPLTNVAVNLQVASNNANNMQRGSVAPMGNGGMDPVMGLVASKIQGALAQSLNMGMAGNMMGMGNAGGNNQVGANLVANLLGAAVQNQGMGGNQGGNMGGGMMQNMGGGMGGGNAGMGGGMGGGNANMGGGNVGMGGSNTNMGGGHSNMGGNNANMGGGNANMGGGNVGMGGGNVGMAGNNANMGGGNMGMGAGMGGNTPNMGGNSGMGGGNANMGVSNANMSGNNTNMGGNNPNMGTSNNMVGNNSGMGGGNNAMGSGNMGMGGSQNSNMGGSNTNVGGIGSSGSGGAYGSSSNAGGGSSSSYSSSSQGVSGQRALTTSSSSVSGQQQQQQVQTSDTVLVRNLPVECNWQSLREGFSHCGDIKYAEMKDRGTGLIRFLSERDAERAVAMMDKQLISGRAIDVRLY